ncbi:regulator [Mycobacterium alsense]|uniref:FHA domain-containing protein n=1 Tax=Mycobacterium alsense TaxID=324058 RepID=A0AA41XHL5_9MYCO|nr:BTAD domain-containing putative transcriptional regulator [Mycobacterium alsense]MCV7377076.1 FHA domain-containing protein [Mycobacterium alsense]OQZ90275.1 regulator [Mycobacterium alsense]
MTNIGLGFGALGPLLMTSHGVRVPVGAPKQRAVLAMLLINRNRPVSVDSLINAVWDEDPVPAARTSIQAHISNLRRLLRSAGADPYQVLASAPPGYQLSVADADCDLGRFTAAKVAGTQAAAAGHYEDASRNLSLALGEWRGPVLDDLRGFAFVDAFATALTEEKVAAHTARAEAEIACGRADGVIGELEALTAEHPYREPLWAQLIIAYYVTERQSDALGAYRRLKTALAEGLGIDPGPTVSALHERILRQEPLGAKASDLTTHRRGSFSFEPTTSSLPLAESATTPAGLRGARGRLYRLTGAITRIGRFTDNDIVLDDTDVSRHHAVITDTGTGFMMTDLRSTNGVEVQGQRIRGSATLADGDHIRIGGLDFTFEIDPA